MRIDGCRVLRRGTRAVDTSGVSDRNVLGGELEPCGSDPLTGFYRDGTCTSGSEDMGSHTVCAVAKQRAGRKRLRAAEIAFLRAGTVLAVYREKI